MKPGVLWGVVVLSWVTCGPLGAASDKTKVACQQDFAHAKERLGKNSSDEVAWTELRVCASELKNWDEAIQVALQARSKNRNLPQPYLILGLAQMHQKNYERAIEHFDQSIALRSEQPVAYFQMGMAYLFLNEPTQAAIAAERAVDLEPNHVSYQRQLAYTYLLLNDLTQAESTAKKAIALDHEDLASHKILAKIYTKAGNAAGAAEELALVKSAEAAYAAAHPELAAKKAPEPKPAASDDDGEQDGEGPEDYELIGVCIGQWNRMKEAMLLGETEKALGYYSDYLDTREQYRESFTKLGPDRLKAIFGSFGELYDCDIIFASAHCKAMVKGSAGGVVVTKIRFERNPDKVWRIRSF